MSTRNPFDGISTSLRAPTFSGAGWRDVRSMTLRGGTVCRLQGCMYRFHILEFQTDGSFGGILAPWFFSMSEDGGQTWRLVGRGAARHFGDLMLMRGISIGDMCHFVIRGDGRILVFGRSSGLEVLIVPPSATAHLLPVSEIQLPAGATLESLVSYFTGGQIPDEIVSRFKAESLPSHESSPDGKIVTVWVAAGVSSVLLKKGSGIDRLPIHRSGRVPHLSIDGAEIVATVVEHGVRRAVIRLPRAPTRIEPMDNGGLRFVF